MRVGDKAVPCLYEVLSPSVLPPLSLIPVFRASALAGSGAAGIATAREQRKLVQRERGGPRGRERITPAMQRPAHKSIGKRKLRQQQTGLTSHLAKAYP